MHESVCIKIQQENYVAIEQNFQKCIVCLCQLQRDKARLETASTTTDEKRRYRGDVPRKSLIYRSWADSKYSAIVYEWNSLPIKLYLGICLWIKLFTNSVTFWTKSWMILVSLPRKIYYFSWWCYQNYCSLMDFQSDKHLPLTNSLISQNKSLMLSSRVFLHFKILYSCMMVSAYLRKLNVSYSWAQRWSKRN